MALTQQQKDQLVNSGAMANYSGMSWDDYERNVMNRPPEDTSPTPQYDLLSQINRIKQAQIASRKAALKGLYNKTKSSLGAERATIKPQYTDMKNQESSSSQIRAQKIGNLMREKGYSEGFQGQKELAMNVATQGNLGLLGRQEQAAYDDIARRETDALNEYNSGLAQAEADADITAAEQRLSELGTMRDYAREDAAKLEQSNEKGKQDWVNSLSIYSYPDIQAEINTIMNDNDTSNDWKIPHLKAVRGQKLEKVLDDEIKTIGQYSGNIDTEIARREASADDVDNMLIPYLKALKQEELSAQAQAQASGNAALYKQMWEQFMKIGYIISDEMAAILRIPKGTKTTEYLQTKYNIGKPYYKASSGGSSGGNDPLFGLFN